MHPTLLPFLPQLWRSATTLQLGVDPERALILTDVTPALRAVLRLLDGRHHVEEILERAEALGLPTRTVHRLLRRLIMGGVAVDGLPSIGLPATMPLETRQRLSADLAALTLRHGGRAGEVLGARQDHTIVIQGGGRIAPLLGSLLGASGVGRVCISGAHGSVGLGDTAVGGLLPGDHGRPYGTATSDAIHRAAPEVDTRPLSASRLPDLLVLGESARLSAAERWRWVSRRVPHLAVGFREGVAIIGPLVVPGVTACLDCLDHHRAERDPAWPDLALQLREARPEGPEPHEVAAVSAAASIAALQVLHYLDGGAPETLGATLELASPANTLPRRSWAPHPDCPCTRLGPPPTRKVQPDPQVAPPLTV
jgi:bacteriocin biosynthesis cyclodehydratase domain-containing protein